jgi:AmmeMemoRadiSam system protein B
VNPKQVKAIIGPHAGYYYSGPTAAWAYQYVTKPHGILKEFLYSDLLIINTFQDVL